MALKSRNETENQLRIYVSFHVKRTRRALGMFLFSFLKRNNEIRNVFSKFPRFHPRTQANIDISAYDSIGPSSILPIMPFLIGYYVNSDYFVLLQNFNDFIYQQATAPRELRMRNANPRTAHEAEETGLGASVFRFPKHETPRDIRWSVSRNETPAKIVFRFCCFITDMFQLWPYTRLLWSCFSTVFIALFSVSTVPL